MRERSALSTYTTTTTRLDIFANSPFTHEAVRKIIWSQKILFESVYATRPLLGFHFADTAAVGVGSTWHGGKHRTVESARTARETLQRFSEDFPRKPATLVTDKIECQKESLGEGLWTPPRPWGVMRW